MRSKPTPFFSLALRAACLALILGCALFLSLRAPAAEPENAARAEGVAEPDHPAKESAAPGAEARETREGAEGAFGSAEGEAAAPAAGRVTPAEPPALAFSVDDGLVRWRTLDEGLELLELGLSRAGPGRLAPASLPASSSGPAELIVLRVDPERYEFTLHMASEDGRSRSLAEYAARHGLTAAINAGMYLPDQRTNTGYMQSGTHVNNPRIVSRFGVFFLAEPRTASLPKARLLEKSDLGDEPGKYLSHYNIVVQNFRLISSEGEILWPESENAHSITSLAQDGKGNILLMLCRFQLSPADFARLIQALPLDCAAAMYLEGGSPAGLLLKSFEGGEPSVWRGRRNSILALDGPADAALPNVIGIRPRPKEAAPQAE